MIEKRVNQTFQITARGTFDSNSNLSRSFCLSHSLPSLSFPTLHLRYWAASILFRSPRRGNDGCRRRADDEVRAIYRYVRVTFHPWRRDRIVLARRAPVCGGGAVTKISFSTFARMRAKKLCLNFQAPPLSVSRESLHGIPVPSDRIAPHAFLYHCQMFYP